MTIYTRISNPERTRRQQQLRASNAAGYHDNHTPRGRAERSDIAFMLAADGFDSAHDVLHGENVT